MIVEKIKLRQQNRIAVTMLLVMVRETRTKAIAPARVSMCLKGGR